MKKINLKNGINLIIEPMLNTHSITIGVYLRAGARYEDKNGGITHLLEHIHFKELNNMTQDELYYNMESIGSTLRAITYYDMLKFSMKIRPIYLQKCVDIFKSIISTSIWKEENFEKEKGVIRNQIDEADSVFSEESIIRQNLFGNSNLANNIMGSKDSVDSIKLIDIITYKEKVFNKNNFIICVTGCVSKNDIEYIESQFGSILICDGEKNIPSNPSLLLFHRRPNIVFYNDSDDLLDVNISFDIDYNKCSINELKILNCILGEGVGSKLQKIVREKLNFTSNIFSEIEIYEDFALLHIKFSVQKKFFKECLSYVFKTIADLKYNITSRDLEVALPFYTENQMFLQDDTEQINFEIAYNTLVLENVTCDFQIKNDNESINHLMSVAKEIFTHKNTSVIVFGNCNKITKKSIKEIVFCDEDVV